MITKIRQECPTSRRVAEIIKSLPKNRGGDFLFKSVRCCKSVAITMDTVDRSETRSCSSVGREASCEGLERAVHIGEVTGSSPVKTTKAQAILLEKSGKNVKIMVLCQMIALPASS